MTIILTGSNGFTARYFADYILRNQFANQIVGIDISTSNLNTNINKYFSINEFDRFTDFCNNIFDEVKLFHFGGLLGNHPINELIEANVVWTSNYLEVAKNIKKLKCFFNTGSSSEYGNQNVDIVHEKLLPNPISNYGISKNLQTQLVLNFSKTYEINSILTRTFNICGPGLNYNFVIGKLIKEFFDVKNSKKSFVEIGRLDSERDFIDIRDAVKIYWHLSELNYINEIFNVGSGKKIKIKNIFDFLTKKFGLLPEIKNKNITLLKNDLDSQCADITKLRINIDLIPEIPIEKSLADMINDSTK